MDLLVKLLAFVAVLGIIIFVHEFGHLLTAKAFGMRVFVFSFGFGRRLFGFKWGDTDCRVSAIPLGGYVKLEGEPGDLVSEDTSALGDGKDFLSRPRWQRFLVYLAGPVMNGVLAIGVMALLFTVGVMADATPFDRPIVGAVDAGSPGERAGLQPLDEILSIDGRAVRNWEEASYQIVVRPEQELKLRIRRSGEEREVPVRSETQTVHRIGSIGVRPLVRVAAVPGQAAEAAGFQAGDAVLAIDGKPVRTFLDIPPIVGASGGKPLSFRVLRGEQQIEIAVTPRDLGQGLRVGLGQWLIPMKYGPGRALGEAARWAWNQVTMTLDVIRRLVTRQISPKTMMGPLGIADASGEAAKRGIEDLLGLVAIISLQVGILNLLPIAPLDGGHLAILGVEGVARRDLSPTVKTWVMNAGAAMIFLLIGLVLYSDISKKLLP